MVLWGILLGNPYWGDHFSRIGLCFWLVKGENNVCEKPFNYCFYINDGHWQKAVGKKAGRWCAHCVLEKLGGLEWYIVWNEPSQKRSESLNEKDVTLENEMTEIFGRRKKYQERAFPDPRVPKM